MDKIITNGMSFTDSYGRTRYFSGINTDDKLIGQKSFRYNLDEEFFNNNPYVLLQHDKATRIYKIISLKEVNENYEHMIVDVPVESRVEHIDNLIENSLYSRYVEYDKNSNILVIQTCSYNDDDTYYVITAIELNK